MTDDAIQALKNNPYYKVLERVPESFPSKESNDPQIFSAAIIDLETMGLEPKKDEIIEIGILWFHFNSQDGIIGVSDQYNALQEPSQPIPEEITKITGITNEDVAGQEIDWPSVTEALAQTHMIICHNSQFDRNFLELQTPADLQAIIKKMPFGCTLKDINWKERDFESSKLDYLNFKLGYFYDGHRALNDCFATFNLFMQAQGSFDELKDNVRKKETLIIAENAPFAKKDLLKNKKYRWSDGQGTLPKAWWTTLSNEELNEEMAWLDGDVYGYPGAAQALPKIEITARQRYSLRALSLEPDR